MKLINAIRKSCHNLFIGVSGIPFKERFWINDFKFLSPREAKELISIAKNKELRASEVSGISEYIDHGARTSKETYITDQESAIVKKVRFQIEKLTGVPRAHQDLFQILKYDQGNFFRLHTDFLKFGSQVLLSIQGNRSHTVVIYLNDNYKGGETNFADADFKIKPITGNGIIFRNTDEAGNLLARSAHESKIIEEGEKWVVVIFVYEKPILKNFDELKPNFI